MPQKTPESEQGETSLLELLVRMKFGFFGHIIDDNEW